MSVGMVDRVLGWIVGAAVGGVVLGLLSLVVEPAIDEWRQILTPKGRCADAWALARTSHDSVAVTLKCGTPAPADSVAPLSSQSFRPTDRRIEYARAKGSGRRWHLCCPRLSKGWTLCGRRVGAFWDRMYCDVGYPYAPPELCKACRRRFGYEHPAQKGEPVAWIAIRDV